MKKSFRILTVLLSVLMLSALTGCALLDRLGISDLVGPEKKWQSYTDYPFEYGKDENGKPKTVYLDLYLLYSDTDYTNINMKNLGTDENGKAITTLKAGLTIIVVPSFGKNDKSILTEVFSIASDEGNPFLIMTMDKGDEAKVETSESEEEGEFNVKSFIVNKTTWAILYNCIDFTNLNTKLPTPLLRDGDYQTLSESAGNFSIKKLLGKLAIKKLSDLIGE